MGNLPGVVGVAGVARRVLAWLVRGPVGGVCVSQVTCHLRRGLFVFAKAVDL
jgi:hypothetical protein